VASGAARPPNEDLEQYLGSTPDDPQKWTRLLDPAVEKMRDAEPRLGGLFEYSVDGGTMLMPHYIHRISNDLDLFVRDVSSFGQSRRN
jgi:hypothetical protein